jgi:hypothetical protein
MSIEFLKGSALFLRRIERRDLNRQRNILIGPMSSGMRSFGVMKRGHNLEDIYGYRLHTKLERKKSTIRIVYNTAIKGRLDGCFRGQ